MNASKILLLVALCFPAYAKAETGLEASAPAEVVVVHRPLHNAALGLELRFLALIDNDWNGPDVVLRYRAQASKQDYIEIAFERSSASGYYAVIPGRAVKRPGLEYYIASKTTDGSERLHFASSQAPHPIVVDIDHNAQWSQEEKRRLRGYQDSIEIDLHVQDFGNRFGGSDELLRSDISFTHRLLHGSSLRLYSIFFGYGFIEGRTPEDDSPMAGTDRPRARYGFAGVEMQVTESVSLRGQTALGFSQDELIAGVRGELTLGKRWQSNLSLGAEYLEEMGPSLWMRLQWDTVPPLLMGVSVVKTDLPGANLRGGTYAAYDLEYPVSPRLKLRANLSFGARDGPGSFGGGVGTVVAF